MSARLATGAGRTNHGHVPCFPCIVPKLHSLTIAKCDPYRPCSLCVRANTKCASTDRSATSAASIHASAERAPPSGTRNPAAERSRKRRRHDIGRDELDVQSSSPNEGQASSPASNNVSVARGGSLEDTRASTSRQPLLAGSPSEVFLLNRLPPEPIMVAFLEEYCISVHWFSLCIYEPRFRPAFDSVRNGFAQPAQRPFLLLLSVVLGLGAWYRGQRSEAIHGLSPQESKAWSSKLIANVESQIVELLDQSSVTAVQTLILLGSFFVYHGRPNLSFSLLGATVKLAHAAGLHKEPTGMPLAEMEERKRVWWTIYTWDRCVSYDQCCKASLTRLFRFASITYGRPISIDESDCSVSQPLDVLETIGFQDFADTDATPICFSTYQRELNKLYMIASPAIKQVYSAREVVGPEQARSYVTMLEEVTSCLWLWHHNLPTKLSLDLSQDCPVDLDPASKAHYLQSLSLQLTFDSLLIILHRPFLKRHLNALQFHGLGRDHGLGVSGLQASEPEPNNTSSQMPSDEATSPSVDSSQQQWWKAASRTAKVVQLPQLAQFACDGHLVAFLAINLFNAAIVMIILALSDPLADIAQRAKRAVARIYRLQVVLGSRSSLSKRSITVLRNLVVLLSHRESQAILAPTTTGQGSNIQDNRISSAFPKSVQDALALPLGNSPGHGLDSHTSTWDFVKMDQMTRIDDSLASVQRGKYDSPIHQY